MTYYYYRTSTWGKEPQAVPEETVSLWEKIIQKENWRIVQLPNGYYQAEYQNLKDEWVDATRRETLEGAESAIDATNIFKSSVKPPPLEVLVPLVTAGMYI